jgi:hypothetical protein
MTTTGAAMDLLPAICIDSEGFDTWARLVNSMKGFHVTLALIDGRTGEGAISAVSWDTTTAVLVLEDVDDEWERNGDKTNYRLEIITGMVVH